MKKILLFTILLCLVFCTTNAQKSLELPSKDLSMESLHANSRKFGMDEEIRWNQDSLSYAIALHYAPIQKKYMYEVFPELDLLSKYPTELKKQRFEQSVEYDSLFIQMKKKKEAWENTYRMIDLRKWSNPGRYFSGSYDLKNKGFAFKFSTVSGTHTKSQLADYVRLHALPLVEYRDDNEPEYLRSFKVLLKMDEDLGLYFEDNIDNLDFYAFFKMNQLEIYSPDEKDKLIFGSPAIQIVVHDRETGKIVFRENYTNSPPLPKSSTK